jgi:PBP1b-binding outer membrane lipoprotein LpoB
MKAVIPLLMTALLLSGCPDARIPKPPPRVPHPKADTTSFYSPAVSPRYTKPAPQPRGWI